MRKMKKFLTLAMTATLLFSSMTVNAAEVSMTAKQNADYMMSTNKDGAPNWFNGAYYSGRYEDLKVAFNTNEKALYNHSLQYGFNESRLVTPVLDVVKYRAFYPDLDKAFGDNWKLYVRHYFEYGINEGRYNFTDFNAKTYLSMYEDLQNAFGNDLVLATRHYIEFGLSEGREYNWPEPEIVYEETVNNNDDDNDSSDSASSDNNNTEEKFTDDNRVENENIIVESTYESGELKSITKYRTNGTKLSYTEFDEQGNQLLTINYQEDGITEDFKSICTYDENGNKTSEKTTYADGSSTETTYENGNITSEKITYADGSSTEITYENGVCTYQGDTYTDGRKYEVEFYEDGITRKKTTENYTDGTKCVIENRKNNTTESWTWYDASGNMTRQQFYGEDGNLISDIDYTVATPSNATPAE